MMKTPFGKVRGLGLHKHDKRDRHAAHRSSVILDELSQASQDMQDMTDCYESLLSAAAGTANNAYELSGSIQEMGDCLLEKTALSDDEDSGRVLLMLGKVQFNIQKLLDNYRSHISQTITVPSESLLNELRIVEDMKKQCDEKRMSYEAMKNLYDKGRMKNSREQVSSRQLQSAQDEFNEDATLFIFRMKSLKRAQSRSLLTQAARHYAAQMSFFRKALKSLEAIEPHVKSTTEQQHIDYHFSGIDDDDRDSVSLANDEDDEDDSDDYYDTLEDGESNFESHRNVKKNEVSISGNSMELGNGNLPFLRAASVNSAKANMYGKPLWNSNTFHIDHTMGIKSAPLSAESTSDPNKRYQQMRQSSTRKLNTYVLPTPLEKNSITSGTETQTRPPNNMWHSMPLEHKKYEDTFKKEKHPGPIVPSKQSVLKEIKYNSKPTPLPAPQTEVVDSRSTSSAKNIKRYAFSGPLTADLPSKKPLVSASGPIGSTISGPLLPSSLTQSLSTSGVSKSNVFSVPIISELHELPRPPSKMASKKPSKVSFSAPLVTVKQGPDLNDANKLSVSDVAYTLPVPSRNQGGTSLASKQTENWNFKTDVAMASPPLSPIAIRNIQ